ncbi:hypothetical protein CH296_27075 [Rhodococcus sp. 14-2496-1d]|nr:hypothetical protein CH296_27075 [Rhodococcus sp. 14-2496-1d]
MSCMVPKANVWMSRSVGLDHAVNTISRWFQKNTNGYSERALLIPKKGELSSPEPALAQYISNGNIGSTKGRSATSGGPVLAIGPTWQLLETALSLADNQALGVIEHIPGANAGWAAAAGAIDLETGEPTPDIPTQMREALVRLHDAGYNGYHRREPYFRARFGPPIETLRANGYSFDFVASYLIALGGGRAHSLEDLRKIYR